MNQYHKINLSNIFFISWIDFLVQFPYDFFLGVFDPPPIKKTHVLSFCAPNTIDNFTWWTLLFCLFFSLKLYLKKIDFLAYNTPRPPMSIHKNFQPNRSSRLAGVTQHLYI